ALWECNKKLFSLAKEGGKSYQLKWVRSVKRAKGALARMKKRAKNGRTNEELLKASLIPGSGQHFCLGCGYVVLRNSVPFCSPCKTKVTKGQIRLAWKGQIITPVMLKHGFHLEKPYQGPT